MKESELQIEFTNLIQTLASRENIPRGILQFRILLCLYAIGTNTGLKCVSSANEFVSYDDLRYVKRRFITVENVRLILTKILNKILEMRDPRIWGMATTSVACDVLTRIIISILCIVQLLRLEKFPKQIFYAGS